MPTRWLRVPIVDPASHAVYPQPKYLDRDGITGVAGQRLAESPRYLGRFDGTTAALDAIEAEPDSQALTDAEVETALNTLLGQNRTIDGWRRGFRGG